MKKGILMIILAIIVVFGVVTWLTNQSDTFKTGEFFMLGGIVLLVGFAIFIAISRIKSAKAGLAPEDELSKRITNKAAAMSYYVSLYWLLFLMYISDRINYESHTLVGFGILGMAILYAGFWLYFNFIGKFNE